MPVISSNQQASDLGRLPFPFRSRKPNLISRMNVNIHKVELRVHSVRLNSLELLIPNVLCCQRNAGFSRSQWQLAQNVPAPSLPALQPPAFTWRGQGHLEPLLPAGVSVESEPVQAQTVPQGARAHTSLASRIFHSSCSIDQQRHASYLCV